jgi:UDP-2,3-diacylglucosamine pyrophosphatase LpxH
VNDLSNDHLTPDEIELLKTEEGAFAVFMGYLKAERGKIAPSVFNSLAKKLGYEKQSKDNVIKLAKKIQQEPELTNLYEKSFKRIITLDDIPHPETNETLISEKDLFAQITNFLIDNEDNNARLRELRKLQREGVYTKILMDNLKKDLKEELMGMPRAKYLKTELPPVKKGDKKLILCFSDWHIGVLVFNESTGGYDFKKLELSVHSVIEEVLNLIDMFGIKEIYVLNLGDFTEHINLRNTNQAFDAEMTLSQQISKAVRLTVDVLSKLSKHVRVVYGQVAGNHDRLQTNKNDAISGDTTAYIILDMLFFIKEDLGQLPNVTLLDNRKDVYSLRLEVCGQNILAKHGDKEAKNGTKINKHIKDKTVDILYMGHYHYASMTQEDFARFTVIVSSPQGANDYSKSLSLPLTFGGQMVTILEEGRLSPIFMPLILKDGRIA